MPAIREAEALKKNEEILEKNFAGVCFRRTKACYNYEEYNLMRI
jgi:hypothetical protein